jgi:hypothetical protein
MPSGSSSTPPPASECGWGNYRHVLMDEEANAGFTANGHTRVETTPEAEAEWREHVKDMYSMLLK